MDDERFAASLAEPDLHPDTPGPVVRCVDRAHEKHLGDWVGEARRRVYDEMVLPEFDSLLSSVDRAVRAASDSSIWTNGSYRIETGAETPRQPTVAYAAAAPHLSAAQVRTIAPELPEGTADVLEADGRDAINHTIDVYAHVSAVLATRRLSAFRGDYLETHDVEVSEEDVPGPGDLPDPVELLESGRLPRETNPRPESGQ